MSNLKRHVRSDKIKWVAVTVALLLVATAVVGMGLKLFGKGKQKPSEWFTKSDKQIEHIVDGEDDRLALDYDTTPDNADNQADTE